MHFKIAINLSPYQLRKSSFLDEIMQIVNLYGVNPNEFEFEITENIFLDSNEMVKETLLALKQLGFSLSIDDFGTGYSSLNYLRQFAIDKIKIDRAFVNNMATDPSSLAIASAIIALSKELKLTVLAEGVETIEQARLLRDKQCDQYQGYYFSKPLPLSEFNELSKALSQEAVCT